MGRSAKISFFTVIILLFVVACINLLSGSTPRGPEKIPFSDLFVRLPSIQSITIEAKSGGIDGEFSDGTRFESHGPPAESPLWSELHRERGKLVQPPTMSFRSPGTLQNLMSLLALIALPLLLFALVYFLLLRPSVLAGQRVVTGHHRIDE